MEKEGDKTGEKGERRLKFGEKLPGRHIYVGETSRSFFEHVQEHIRDGIQKLRTATHC